MNELIEDAKEGLSPLKGFKRYILGAIILVVTIGAFALLPFWWKIGLAAVFGVLLAPLVILALSPLYKNELTHNPNSKRNHSI